jgi:ABC-type multidrug transport system fused ATPase/permease subunit
MMSGGQMQRLCLARALLRKAEYLLLDEITSALDRVTEKLVMDVILKSQCAAVLVTHRLNYLKDYDRVILMDSGQIIALGHFNELMANSAAFRNFYNRLSSQTNML